MTNSISIKAAKLAKYGEHFDSAEQCFLIHPGSPCGQAWKN